MKQDPHRPCSCKQVNPGAHEIARREFLKRALAAGAAGALASRMGYADIEALYASGNVGDKAAVEAALEAWTKHLWDLGLPRVYREKALEHIAFPLGGIGAGQVYLTGRGRLTAWQIQNNFKTDMSVPGALFAVRTKNVDGTVTTRLLEENPDAPEAVSAIEAECEYPFCTLRYRDEALPVDIQMEAWSPFEPLNAKDSGLPAALFTFTLHNRQNSPVEVSLLASMQNKIGWDGYTATPEEGLSGLEYMGNENRFERGARAARLRFQTQTGEMPGMSLPCALYTPDFITAHLMRLCEGLRVEKELKFLDASPGECVLWLGPGEAYPAESEYGALLEQMSKGATLVLIDNGDGILPLLSFGGDTTADTEVFDDFESKSYANWHVEGDCFGDMPAAGRLPGQQPVEGYRGAALVNTFRNGDGTTGKAVSRSFVISRKYIHFLIGGGSQPDGACFNLVIDGARVRTATGLNEERLRPMVWDVSEFKGREAVLEIVDTVTGGWGHINIDHITFSDSSMTPLMDAALLQACRDALPFSFTGVTRETSPSMLIRKAAELRLPEACASTAAHLRFTDFQLKPGAAVLAEAEDGAPVIVSGAFGEGRIIVCNGLYSHTLPGPAARDLAGTLIAFARGAEYRPQTGWSRDALPYGTMELCVLDGDGPRAVTALPQWEDRRALWGLFSGKGDFEGADCPQGPAASGRTWNGALAARVGLGANETKTVTFVLAWHFPNRMRDHHYIAGPRPFLYDYRLGNRYNNWFADAGEATDYIIRNYDRLYKKSRAFHDSFYATTLPRWLLDAITANIANLRSPLYLWLEDGTVAAYEGTDCCCPMNCTHVFNYVMTPAFLFPELERNVRETDLLVQMHPEEHYIPHRTVLPLSAPRLGFEIGGPHHPALDGELGTLLKVCREWRQSGDTEWLKTLWPLVKTHLEYLMATHDPDGTGVIRGEQPNTYDTHLYGSNTFIGTLYLAVLLATERMASVLGDDAFARLCRERYECGRTGYEAACWNGEYYYNVYDAPESPDLDYNRSNCWGPGCHADQLLGQWWADILGLGYVLPEAHVLQALDAIYRHCWRGRLDLPEHKQRVFAEPWERGLLNCAWPQGGRPEHPILYCDEVWTGIEYEVAAILIRAGRVEQGLQIIKAARDRYTGDQRNPMSEIECGGHYARAMSSYALLLAGAGLEYDAPDRRLVFAPRFRPEAFKCFFTFADGYGTLAQEDADGVRTILIQPAQGSLELSQLRLEHAGSGDPKVRVKRPGADYAVSMACGHLDLQFTRPLTITKNRPLRVEISIA